METFAKQVGVNDVTFCEIVESLVDVDNIFSRILRTCCDDATGDETPECCRCNRRLVDDPDNTQVFFFKSLKANDECPAIWPGNADDPNSSEFAAAVEVAPGQKKKNQVAAMLEDVPKGKK